MNPSLHFDTVYVFVHFYAFAGHASHTPSNQTYPVIQPVIVSNFVHLEFNGQAKQFLSVVLK